jgi:ubiquinone/menaquinone biosynthesis C-methylase UbiE
MTNQELKSKMVEFYTETDQYYQRLVGHFAELEKTGLKFGSIDVLEICRGKGQILDCGCGSGSLSIYLSKQLGEKTYGVDLSEFGVNLAGELAKKVGAECEFKSGDIEKNIPFPDGFFDLVIMAEVMEHLVNPERAVAEVARVLKKDGLFLLYGPNLVLRSPILMLKKIPQFIKMLFDKKYLPKTLLNPKFDVSVADSDAVYLTNPTEAKRMLNLSGLKILQASHFRCIFIAQK